MRGSNNIPTATKEEQHGERVLERQSSRRGTVALVRLADDHTGEERT